MALILPWDYAAGLATASFAAGVGLKGRPNERQRAVGAFLREASVVIGLYALWQLVRRLSLTSTTGASERAEWIQHTEAAWHLPSEASVQHWILWSPALTHAANIYYAVVHFPATIALLIWLFVRHRGRYSEARWVLALTTLLCLAIQFLPVAPPRLMPGFVDTGIEYGQSVYGDGWGAAQLSAMPSVHMAWAVIVGWYVWRVGARRWRWVGPLHACLTAIVVVVTANHWWLDELVAVAIVAGVVWAVARIARSRRVDDRETVSGGGLELIRRPAHPEPQIRVFPRKGAGPSSAADTQIRDNTRTCTVGSTRPST